MKALLAAFVLALVLTAAATGPDARAAAGAADPAQVLVLLASRPAHFRPGANYASGYADAEGRAARRRTAESLARLHGLRLATDWPIAALGLDCYVMDVPAPRRPEDVADQLAHEPGVAWAQVMNVFRSLGHDDPLFDLQPATRPWRLDELHALASGRGVRVAVIDSSIQADHPDLSEQIALRENFVADRPDVGELHGTAVAGIIAARADNHLGIAGVAPHARLLALRACAQASPALTLCTSLSLARALNSAVEHGAQVVNLSLGGPTDRLVQRLIESALARDIAVVAAVDRAAPDGGFPARLPKVIAAVDGARPSTPPGAVVAPGADIPTTLPGSRWATVSGSSYAAAHVSGLLALMLDARSRSGPAGAAAHAIASDLVLDAGGSVDACASLARAASAACVCACGPAPAGEPIALH